MSAIEQLRRLVELQATVRSLVKADSAMEFAADDMLQDALTGTDFAALLAEVEELVSVEGLAKQLLSLSPEDRAAVMHQFCRCCHKPISALDWSGGNFCDSCSPEPED